jgi:hypothetical protein
MLKMQRSPKSPKSLKSRKHQLASGASWIFLVLVVGLVSRPICGARWHSMFVTVSKWTWLYPNATFSFVQDLRLALLFQPKREMERYPQKNMFDLHSYHGNRQSIQVKMAPGYGCLQILQNIYYHILFNHIYIYVCISYYIITYKWLKGSSHDLKVWNITEHAWKLSSFGTVQALWSRRLPGLHNLTLLWVHLHRTCSWAFCFKHFSTTRKVLVPIHCAGAWHSLVMSCNVLYVGMIRWTGANPRSSRCSRWPNSLPLRPFLQKPLVTADDSR